MNIVRFKDPDGIERYGAIEGDSVIEIAGTPFKGSDYSGRVFSVETVDMLAPCMPSKIVCLGVNYHGHASEMGHKVPDAPLIFLKPSTAVIGPGALIRYPEISRRVDYEAELAVVIKKPAWRVSQDDAAEYILGYTCFNDITARDLQQQDGQWTRAKGFDTFAAIGPWVATDIDVSSVNIETYLNGERKQHGNTADLIYGIDYLVHFISHVMTLLPGDVIATGTPSGIGPMQAGDTVEIKIEHVGTLRNKVIAAEQDNHY